MSKPTHPFHILDPSPWPLCASISALVWTIGLILYAREVNISLASIEVPAGLITLLSGTVMLFASSYGWWCDVVKESKTSAHTNKVKLGLRYGMVLFIVSEACFFVAFFGAYFYAGFSPTEAIGSVWPPAGMKTFHPADLPFLNTLILLCSGSTITWAHEHLLNNEIKKATRMTAITVCLGLFFSVLQGVEYAHSPFAIEDNIYASIFFITTGLHGVHVIIGTIFLTVCFFRLKAKHFKPTDHFGFEAAAWYWHFVDIVWLFLFFSIYCWGAAPV